MSYCHHLVFLSKLVPHPLPRESPVSLACSRLQFDGAVSLTAHTRGNRHGAQNVGDEASKSTLENEFGTSNDDECMTKILEGGTVQSTEVSHVEHAHAIPGRKKTSTDRMLSRQAKGKAQRMIPWVGDRPIKGCV